jgi:hypothetical protein
LAAILDAWSRRVEGYAISRSIDVLVSFREQFCRPPPSPYTARCRLKLPARGHCDNRLFHPSACVDRRNPSSPLGN